MDLRGKFLVLDGPDGAGKGTQLDRLAAWITAQGAHCRRARDPGGTPIGERIRHVVLDYDLSGMDSRCEMLLFMASRAQLVAETIRPALAAGETVLCDRFISATCAYQGAIGVPADEVIAVGRAAVGTTWPDLTIILDVPPQIGFQRIGRRIDAGGGPVAANQVNKLAGASHDAMERRPIDFHARVRDNFLGLPRWYPRPVVILDATRDVEAVWADIEAAVRDALT